MTTLEYQLLRGAVFERAGYRCECCRVKPAAEIEHAWPRSQGGPDSFANAWATCTPCHRWKEAPFANGRLVVVPVGDGRFRWEEWRGPDKWTATLIRIVRDTSL